MIMSAIIYYNSVSSLRQEIEQSNLNKLEQVEKITAERMKELETLAARISYDPRLTPYMISHDYYSGEAIDELKKYKANSSIIEELFVYYHAKDTLYSTSGSYSIDALLQKKYRFDGWEKEDFVEDLHMTIPSIRFANNVIADNSSQGRMIAYLFPIAPNNPAPFGTVMYLIKESVLTDLIQNILGDFKGNTYMLNENGQVVASTINDNDIIPEKLKKLAIKRDGIQNVAIDGKDYSLTAVKSEVNGWTFITIMDADQFFEKLDNTKTLIVVTLISLLLLGFALAILIGRSQYKPIRSLFEITNRNKKDKDGLKDGNEWETIHHTITTVFEDHQILNETMYRQKPFAREQLLVKLLKGDIRKNDEIESLLHSVNIKMRNDYYFVAILYFDKGTFKENNIEQREEVFSVLAEFSLLDSTVHPIDLLYDDAIAVIISMDWVENNPDKQRQLLVQKLKQHIQATTFLEPTIGVGELYAEKSLINRSYIEALAAMEYKFVNPQGSIIYFEDISLQSEQALGYPQEEQIKLVQSLKQGDEVVAVETLRKIFAMLADKDISIQVSKAVCFDIINTIVKTVSELGLGKHLNNYNQIVDFPSIEQLYKELCSVIYIICKEVEAKKESHNDKLRNDILDYIKTNYQLYELTLGNMAIEFQLSISYLSRFIKDQTGVTFTQYIQDLRMEDVKKQLRKTDQPISKIITQVGYKDVANFTRKFKQVVGVTPGQYRKLNK